MNHSLPYIGHSIVSCCEVNNYCQYIRNFSPNLYLYLSTFSAHSTLIIWNSTTYKLINLMFPVRFKTMLPAMDMQADANIH